MVDTFGEASSAFRTSPFGTGVNDDTGVNVSAGKERSRNNGQLQSQGSIHTRGPFTSEAGVPETLCPRGYVRHQGQSSVPQASLKGHSRGTQGALKGQ